VGLDILGGSFQFIHLGTLLVVLSLHYSRNFVSLPLFLEAHIILLLYLHQVSVSVVELGLAFLIVHGLSRHVDVIGLHVVVELIGSLLEFLPEDSLFLAVLFHYLLQLSLQSSNLLLQSLDLRSMVLLEQLLISHSCFGRLINELGSVVLFISDLLFQKINLNLPQLFALATLFAVFQVSIFFGPAQITKGLSFSLKML